MFGVLLRPTRAMWPAGGQQLWSTAATQLTPPFATTSTITSSSSSSSSSSFSSLSFPFSSSSPSITSFSFSSTSNEAQQLGRSGLYNLGGFSSVSLRTSPYESIRFQSSLHLGSHGRMASGEPYQQQQQQQQAHYHQQHQAAQAQQTQELLQVSEDSWSASASEAGYSSSTSSSTGSPTALVVAEDTRKPSMAIFKALAEKGPMTRLDLYNAVVSETLTKTRVKHVLRLLIDQRHVRVRRNPAPPKKGRKSSHFLFEVYDFRKEPFCSHPLLIRLRQENWRYQHIAKFLDSHIKRPKA